MVNQFSSLFLQTQVIVLMNASYVISSKRYLARFPRTERHLNLMARALHKPRRPIKSKPAAELLATKKALEAFIKICSVLKCILSAHIEAWELDVIKELHQSLTTQHISFDRPVSADNNFIW